jgi:Bacterial toxin 44
MVNGHLVWGNLVFGYIGTLAGFSSDALQVGAAFAGIWNGGNPKLNYLTPSQIIEHQTGINMAHRCGYNITSDAMEREIDYSISDLAGWGASGLFIRSFNPMN